MTSISACEDMPILQLNKTETGKISRERTFGSIIWRPHLFWTMDRQRLETKPLDFSYFWMVPHHI